MQFGRYRFVDRLAVGGMAEVFVVVAQGSEGFEKKLVLKLMLPHLAEMSRFRTMFLDEARITGQLHHGNIVQIMDMGTLEGRPFLALEFVDGYDLRTVFRRAQQKGVRIPHALIAYIASEVCRALDYAHRKKGQDGLPLQIVHRDVNPANIFLSHEGAVKVGDFGLAKARDNLDQSEAGLLKGKLSYMSPEQVAGIPIDHRSDLFSLGTSIYELACGRRPFVADSDVGLLTMVRDASFRPPSQLVSGIDPALEKIILRAMARDRDRRYPTANAVRDDLLRYIHSLGVPAGDRDLADFVATLFGNESHAGRDQQPVQIPLPPVMRSVASVNGYSEFRRSDSSSDTEVTMAPRALQVDPLRQEIEFRASVSRRRRVMLAKAAAAMLVLFVGVGAMMAADSDAPALATLRIGSDPPGADVSIDGVSVSQQTPAVVHELALGKEIVVSVHREGMLPETRRFHFDQPGDYSHSFELEAETRSVTVTTVPPGAEVLLDGESNGPSPVTLTMSAGEHSITARADGYHEETVAHDPSDSEGEREIRLREKPEPTRSARKRSSRPEPSGPSGTVEIDTNVRAVVYVDGRRAGSTPGFRKQIPVGRHEIELRPRGDGIRHRAQMYVREGRTLRIRPTPPKP